MSMLPCTCRCCRSRDAFDRDNRLARIDPTPPAGAGGAVACSHEAYQGECMHCGVPIRNGRPLYPSPAAAQPERAGGGERFGEIYEVAAECDASFEPSEVGEGVWTFTDSQLQDYANLIAAALNAPPAADLDRSLSVVECANCECQYDSVLAECPECNIGTDGTKQCNLCGYNPAPPAADGMVLTANDVKWIVNDNAELGVMIHGRAFFLYKGESMEYTEPVHDDGTPMLYRMVGKREFGECCHPAKFYRDGEPGDGDWRPLIYVDSANGGDHG
jgi:hypothetical protein